jgi:hypothetical protein
MAGGLFASRQTHRSERCRTRTCGYQKGAPDCRTAAGDAGEPPLYVSLCAIVVDAASAGNPRRGASAYN